MKQYTAHKKHNNGLNIKRSDAQKVGKEIQRLIDVNDGQIKPLIVVENARNKSSPLHEYFDWNDTIAAGKWRISQAGMLLRWVQIELIKDKPSRAFVNITDVDTRQNVYLSIEKALGEPELRKQLLNDSLRELDCWERKYQTLKELSLIFSAVKKVKRKFKK